MFPLKWSFLSSWTILCCALQNLRIVNQQQAFQNDEDISESQDFYIISFKIFPFLLYKLFYNIFAINYIYKQIIFYSISMNMRNTEVVLQITENGAQLHILQITVRFHVKEYVKIQYTSFSYLLQNLKKVIPTFSSIPLI